MTKTVVTKIIIIIIIIIIKVGNCIKIWKF